MNLLVLVRKIRKQSMLEFSDLSVYTKQVDTLSVFISIRRDNQINDMET